VVAVDLDLGSDSSVFIRGQGGGLRWDQGKRLNRVGPRTWIWSANGCSEMVEFQLLIDDEVWARGQTHTVEPGGTARVAPDFEWPEIPKVA
jgi:hypothetical protein